MTFPAKKTYPKVLTFAFAGDLVLKNLNFQKRFKIKTGLLYSISKMTIYIMRDS